ncbi:hypothetical protein MKW98_026801 [Papaver atlanticum]|uniref:40S ribosomal protein S30 n=1 Tax=Papaver atlanticum TaxID=357466 RepID=A0AAD4X5K2_9MAGN|nr:hypothetical protein MKW98_026801 [Papaver atlanticum]
MCKVYGSLARGEKVTGQNPKVAKQDRKKKPRSRTNKSIGGELVFGKGAADEVFCVLS